MPYRVQIDGKANKEILALGRKDQARIIEKIAALENDPRPHGVKKLTGTDDRYRIRSGNFRVIYAINDSVKLVDILNVSDRKDAYD